MRTLILQYKGSTYTSIVDDELIIPGRPSVIFFSKKSTPLMYVRVQIPSRKRRYELLHRLVIGAKKGEVVDHINKDTMDNRRENLRIVTVAQNAWNRKKQAGRCPNTSGFIGVFKTPKGRFSASISINNKSFRLGVYDTAEMAAMAYDRKALEVRGHFAVLNFPRSTTESLASSSALVREG